MWRDHFLIGTAWVAYCVLHSWLAATRTKEKARQLMKSSFKFYRPLYTVFSFAGLVLLLWWLVIMKSPGVFERNDLVFALGILLCLAGFTLMAVCIKKYFLSLSGLKSLLDEHHSNELIITGIHRHMRHPLYLGTFAFIWGLWLVFPTKSFLISNVIITIYTLVGIKFEEQKLIAEFGEQYRRYQQNVPKLFPRLGKKSIN
jgi:protein-S-isoprenylcysteine O-methyltransferase Ste14